jgi:hypothetical protein
LTTEVLPKLSSSVHLSLPMKLPCIDQLNLKELHGLHHAFTARRKEARSKANKLLAKNPVLSSLWTKSLSSNLSGEEKSFVFGTLDMALLKHPDIYISYAEANTMTLLSEAIWCEIVRRTAL